MNITGVLLSVHVNYLLPGGGVLSAGLGGLCGDHVNTVDVPKVVVLELPGLPPASAGSAGTQREELFSWWGMRDMFLLGALFLFILDEVSRFLLGRLVMFHLAGLIKFREDGLGRLSDVDADRMEWCWGCLDSACVFLLLPLLGGHYQWHRCLWGCMGPGGQSCVGGDRLQEPSVPDGVSP